ncbi:MarR family winged helix-turn-helix transcriptional regulator [Cellulomonas shaoxiangyii]|uniref:MarR family transcriptional regulator n=1 Tax=Cellulomonas shaoxiangyii TaxID=2566013 RepID=A0A4P7SHA7_9CELL|nr:MarR family transcriptional regulator [Cellulomonas shaoxiangyii]QCB92476.1 MarR family transcriptional regulator [Cellulomonas shaoxiangyii]TGY84972.1 MarR family transcriptional regulator [Cellulomonas shaoxiangyii]
MATTGAGPGREDEDATPGPVSLAVFRLARAHRALAADLLREIGLHPGQELLLLHLWEHGPQRQADLARLVSTDSAAMTRTVQRLERAGYVRRVPSPDDGRVSLVEPTAASQALRARVEAMWRTLEDATVAGMSTQEQAAALDVLARLEANATTAEERGRAH